MKKLTTVECLEKGLKRIKRGWLQGQAYDERGGRCASAALDGLENYNARRYLGFAISGNPYYDIVGFNDNQKTTKKHVVAAFERAIKYAKRRHLPKTPLKLPA